MIARLAAASRAAGVPVVHVRHRAAEGPFHPADPSSAPMPCAEALPGEAVFEKMTSSAFASTDLEAHLRGAGISRLVIAGAVAGFCVSSTTRAACDLGFDCVLVRDAVLGFALPGVSARALFDAHMAVLGADFARLAGSGEAEALLAGGRRARS